jgi:hypothetical protein
MTNHVTPQFNHTSCQFWRALHCSRDPVAERQCHQQAGRPTVCGVRLQSLLWSRWQLSAAGGSVVVATVVVISVPI